MPGQRAYPGDAGRHFTAGFKRKGTRLCIRRRRGKSAADDTGHGGAAGIRRGREPDDFCHLYGLAGSGPDVLRGGGICPVEPVFIAGDCIYAEKPAHGRVRQIDQHDADRYVQHCHIDRPGGDHR